MTERCNALAEGITVRSKQVLYREFARSLFGRLRSPRRRALAARQLRIIDALLDSGPAGEGYMEYLLLMHYEGLKFPMRALVRDLLDLLDLSALVLTDDEHIDVNLDWPQQFSQSALLERYERMPSASGHPAMAELSRLLGRLR